MPSLADPVYTLCMLPGTLTHLLEPQFVHLADASVEELLDAQARTAGMVSLDANAEVLTEMQQQTIRNTFGAITNPETPIDVKKDAILALRVPQAVRHLAGMLSEYDWEFVEQAKQIRSYVVAKLLEETKSGDARIRLRALELTGKLTEVGSFTERVEITHKEASASELEERIRAKLRTLLPPVQEIETLTSGEVGETIAPTTPNQES